MSPAHRKTLATCAAVALSFGLAGCGDDDDAGSAAAPVTEDVDPVDVDDPGDPTVVVTLADYEFRDLPPTIPAGTSLRVVNAADEELHELVAFRLAGDEDRSVEELVGLPPAELGALMGSWGEPATVLLAAPDGPQIAAVGDGTLSEPGRYAVICMIPLGVEPDVYLEAAQQSDGGPPQIEGAGPPHITAGMYAELVVE